MARTRRSQGEKKMISIARGGITQRRFIFLIAIAAVLIMANSTVLAAAEKNTDDSIRVAAVNPVSVLEEIAVYEGADRQQRLLAGAKKEGSLNLYATMILEHTTLIAEAFEKKYGIKVNIWRSSSENVLQRTITEAQGRRFNVDVVETNSPELESLHREKLVQPVKSPYTADLIPQAVPPHHEWVGARLNIFVQAYNTDKVKQEELPKSYEDLLDPRWKGRLGIEAANVDWFATLMKERGEEKGLALFKKLIATNGASVRKGHPLLISLVASGEIPLALSTYSYLIDRLKKEKAAPIEWFVIPPTIARVSGVAIARKAPHPHAALLFYDFMLSDVQPLLLKLDSIPASKKLASYPAGTVKFIDPVMLLDEQDKWVKLYEQIVLQQGTK